MTPTAALEVWHPPAVHQRRASARRSRHAAVSEGQRPPQTTLPTGTLTLLLTDVEGSTRLWEQHPESMRSALARHDELVEQAVGENAGQVVRPRGEGDSRFAVFVRASDAIVAAAGIQRALHDEPWPLPVPLRVRIAVHTGEVDLRGGDYYGTSVNRCARVRELGRGGQVLVSRATQALVRDQLPRALRLRSMGEYVLRDLAQPEEIFQLVVDGLPDEYLPLVGSSAVNAAPVTPLIGRVRELGQLLELMANPGVRMLTLIGPGGVGKTSLARATADSPWSPFGANYSFVDLSQLHEPDLVWPSVAHALGLRDEGQELPLDLIERQLRAQRRLLVLDNLEQVLGIAPALARLLEACAHVKVLATSREPLRVRAEHVFEVSPLALPEPGVTPRLAALHQSAAVQLLVERARASDPDFELNERNATAVAQLCARLDGLPLALELAASQLRVLPPELLLQRLGERLNVARGMRDMPTRHQSLRLAVDWSYELLDEPQRTLFARLAVFSGGCSLGAAEVVCCVDGDLSVLDGLVALADRSLVRRGHGAEGEARFAFLETIRDHARERLIASGEQHSVERRHVECFTALAEKARSFLRGEAQVRWLDSIEGDHDNIRAALRWAIDQEDSDVAVRIAGRVAKYWSARGAVAEGRAWLDAALAIKPLVESAARAVALMRAGELAWQQADVEHAAPLIEAGLRLARAMDEQNVVSSCLAQLGWMAQSRGELEQAVAYLEESLACARRAGDQRGAAVALHNLGCCWLDIGDLDRARPALEQSQATFQEIDDLGNIADGFLPLGDLARRSGDSAAAEHYYRESLRLAEQLGNLQLIANSMEGVASIACLTNRPERGAQLSAAAATIRTAIGVPQAQLEAQVVEADLATARAALGQDRFTAAWSSGQLLDRQGAIALALADSGFDLHSNG
jgi:predicted ATPase/class 3 adenylate cyclase